MKKVGPILLPIVLLELFLGGGGRFTALGPVSLRMILFGLAMIYTVLRFIKGERIESVHWTALILFILSTGISTAIGFINNADHTLIYTDVKPLSYFVMLPFFALTITDKKSLDQISKLLVASALILAVLYLTLLALVNTSIIPFKFFYQFTLPSEELFYRGELAFFYKGFIFLCIGLIFTYFNKPPYWKFIAIILFSAILLTFTRGFILALALAAFSYLIIGNTSSKVKLIGVPVVILIALMVIFKGNDIYASISKQVHASEIKTDFTREIKPENLLGNRDFSNNERKKQFDQVLSSTTFLSALIGHGFGIGVPVRPVHMEISYLEIFHKQGVLGLIFWAFIFFLLTRSYFKARTNYPHLCNAFYFSSLFIFYQSLTNQYFNNPIGMSFILISLVSLHLISEKDG